ncbi:class I SAM-dependent methyltransferase [Kitasatospora sp. NPDC054939]
MSDRGHLSTTREAYDAVAALYAELFADSLAGQPLDRAMLAAFAESVRGTPGGAGPVADVGCGPGWVTDHLRQLGLDAYGLDLSPAMIALARAAYPELRFELGSLTALDATDGSLGGIVARYSLIHTPPGELLDILREFHRALAPGGHLLVSFFADPDPDPDPVADPDPDRVTDPGGPATDPPAPQAFDHKVTAAYRWTPGAMADQLRRAGLTETARLVRRPEETERFLQATLIVHKPKENP